MLDFTLTEEQQMLQKTAREFAQNEIRPVVEEIERLDRSKSRPWDVSRKMYEKAVKLGFTSMLIPQEYGGGGLGCLENVLLEEEFGAVDVGIAATLFNMSIAPVKIIEFAATPEQRERWLRELVACDTPVLASAGNEPNVAGCDFMCPYPDPRIGIQTFARKDGDSYVINGQKAGFITNAGVASYYFVIARTDLTKPQMESSAFFFVPADTPGLRVGRSTDLLGWRTAQSAEVYFEDMRVPREALVGGEEGGANSIFLMQAMPYVAVGLAAVYVGLARAAYEYALEYAQQRVSWGQPIIRHQSITAMLADMVVETQAARLVVWDAAWHTDRRSEQAAIVKSPSAKTFAVDVAIRNAERALKILGAYGICQEYRTAKYLCDAWVGWPCDGPNTMLRLHMANMLFGLYGPPPGAGPGGGPPVQS